MSEHDADDQFVLTVKQAQPMSKLGRNLFYSILGTKEGPPIKRVRGRILIPVKSFRKWLETPTRTRKG